MAVPIGETIHAQADPTGVLSVPRNMGQLVLQVPYVCARLAPPNAVRHAPPVHGSSASMPAIAAIWTGAAGGPIWSGKESLQNELQGRESLCGPRGALHAGGDERWRSRGPGRGAAT